MLNRCLLSATPPPPLLLFPFPPSTIVLIYNLNIPSKLQISELEIRTSKDPFDQINLASVPFELYDKLKLAKEDAEDAEVELFEPAIKRAGGENTSTGRALRVGLLKNRVLFATVSTKSSRRAEIRPDWLTLVSASSLDSEFL